MVCINEVEDLTSILRTLVLHLGKRRPEFNDLGALFVAVPSGSLCQLGDLRDVLSQDVVFLTTDFDEALPGCDSDLVVGGLAAALAELAHNVVTLLFDLEVGSHVRDGVEQCLDRELACLDFLWCRVDVVH